MVITILSWSSFSLKRIFSDFTKSISDFTRSHSDFKQSFSDLTRSFSDLTQSFSSSICLVFFSSSSNSLLKWKKNHNFWTISVFWPPKMFIFSRRSITGNALMLFVKFKIVYFLNIYLTFRITIILIFQNSILWKSVLILKWKEKIEFKWFYLKMLINISCFAYYVFSI